MRVIILILCAFFLLSAETLFEVKDSANNKVFDVSTDGIAVMNLGDTIMVISTTEIKAVIDDSKALSRKFSVSTTSAKKGLYTDLFDVSLGSSTMRESGGNRYTDFSPENIFIGLNAGVATTPGVGTLNLFFGNDCGKNNTTGGYNIMMGDKSGQNNTIGGNNLFIGNNSGEVNSSGSWNMFLGHGSGRNNTATNNMFMGHNAGYTNVSGISNLFVGADAGAYNNSGSNNVFIGQSVGIYNTSANNNTLLGWAAGSSNNSSDNTCLGYRSGAGHSSGDKNLFVGALSGQANSTGSYNTFMGYAAGQNSGAASNSTCIGYYAGYSSTGYGNTFLGWGSGRITTGDYNVMLGNGTGNLNTSGNYNVFLGTGSGHSNVTGSGNVFLGNDSGYNETGSNKLYIDNSDTATPLIHGDFSTDALTVNGSLTATGNANVSGTYFKVTSNPGTGTTPTNYVYQGGSTASTSKEYAFAVNDALWVTSHAFIDGGLQINGGTLLGMTQAGTYTAGVNSTGGVKTFTITFPSTFGTIPKVNVTPKGENFPDVFAVTTRNITTTSFQVNVYRVDSAGGIWGQNLKLDWFAWE